MKYRLQQYEDGTFGYLNIDGNMMYNFETESLVDLVQGEDEDREEFIAKNDITFSKGQYGSNEELDRMINDEDWFARARAASQGHGLDKLINDEEIGVRREIAEQGYCLDKLIKDGSYVREGVAIGAAKEKRYDLLDILINDAQNEVRRAVAKQGYGLNILVNDKSYWVRYEVAKHGYGLDILINDEDEDIIKIVIEKAVELNREDILEKVIDTKNEKIKMILSEHGYGLDKFAYDENEDIRQAVSKYLESHNMTLKQWKNLHKI